MTLVEAEARHTTRRLRPGEGGHGLRRRGGGGTGSASPPNGKAKGGGAPPDFRRAGLQGARPRTTRAAIFPWVVSLPDRRWRLYYVGARSSTHGRHRAAARSERARAAVLFACCAPSGMRVDERRGGRDASFARHLRHEVATRAARRGRSVNQKNWTADGRAFSAARVGGDFTRGRGVILRTPRAVRTRRGVGVGALRECSAARSNPHNAIRRLLDNLPDLPEFDVLSMRMSATMFTKAALCSRRPRRGSPPTVARARTARGSAPSPTVRARASRTAREPSADAGDRIASFTAESIARRWRGDPGTARRDAGRRARRPEPALAPNCLGHAV